jgi:hypothetical protein
MSGSALTRASATAKTFIVAMVLFLFGKKSKDVDIQRRIALLVQTGECDAKHDKVQRKEKTEYARYWEPRDSRLSCLPLTLQGPLLPVYQNGRNDCRSRVGD